MKRVHINARSEIMPPAPLERSIASAISVVFPLAMQKRPLCQEAVMRILMRTVSQYASAYRSCLNVYRPEIIRWATLRDGTTVGIVEDRHSGVRYAWSIDPDQYDVVSYGPVNE